MATLLILGCYRRALLGERATERVATWRSQLQRLRDALSPLVRGDAELVDLDASAPFEGIQRAPRPDAVALVALTACSTQALERWILAARATPFVVLAPRPHAAWNEHYGLGEHLAGSGQVGAAMISALLARHAVRFIAHASPSPLHLDERVRTLLDAAATAGRLQRLRLLRIEGAHAGYVHMELPADWSTGPWTMGVAEAELGDVLNDDATPTVPAPFDLSALAGYSEDEALRREVALRDAVLRRLGTSGAQSTAINGARVYAMQRPLLGKIALSLLGADGIASADTGDVLAAALLFAAKGIARAALYCEVNATAHGGTWMCTTTGEADLAWLSLDRGATAVLTKGADLWSDAWTLRLDVGTGPATLVGIAPAGTRARSHTSLRFVTVEGEADSHAKTRLARSVFAFRAHGPPAPDADATFGRWLSQGTNHHACLVDGHASDRVAQLAHLIGAEIVRL